LKAIVTTKYGGPEVLQLQEIEKPSPKDNEVLVKVHAVSVNDWDWAMLDGSSLFNRLFSGFRKPKVKVLGSDVAGVVEAVGKDVTKFRVGDEVYGDLSGTWGGLAEYVCAKETALALKPPAMNFIQAAAIPQAGMLAVQGLEKGKIRSGQKLLINGAGGGVGTLGIQLARQYDVEVTGVDNTGKLDLMRSMGFDHVIDYTKEDFTRNGLHYDLILDTKTNRSLFAYTRSLSRGGIYTTVGGSISRLLQMFLLSPLISLAGTKKIRVVALKPNRDLAYINELFIAGKLKPVIDGSYRLEDTQEAFRLFGEAKHKGKIVITI
jgi:NADPH:quinone reductase-like Zn-dependent oxidoreductase